MCRLKKYSQVAQSSRSVGKVAFNIQCMYWVYILKSDTVNRYYVGQTANTERRLFHHMSGKEKYTKRASDWRLVYSKEFKTRIEAQKIENFIKKQKSRVFIEKIITGKINLDIVPV